MAYRWETPASVWLEDETSGAFALAASEGMGQVDWLARAQAGGPVSQRVPDIARLLGASLPTACEHAPIYPEGFAFCPECGRPLERFAIRQARQPDWWGPHADPLLPRHVPHGLPVTSLALGNSLEERAAAPAIGRFDTSMPTPPNAHCVFAAAGFGFPEQRLLALAPGRGVLQYWDPLAEAWLVMLPEDGAADLSFTASDYGWLPVLEPHRGEVALVPTAGGLRRLWINPVSETYRTETLLAAPLVAAPGTMRRHTACLARNPAGGLSLYALDADLAPAPAQDCGALPLNGWSRPIGYDGRLLWLHPEGQLAWRPGEAPRFTPWPDTWLPSLDLGGPTLSRDGRMWQLGHDGQSYCFLELGAGPSMVSPQRERIDGARLGFANLLFRRGHPVLDEPWSGEHVEDQAEDDSLVLPLLRSFNNNRSQPSGLVLRFHKYTGRAEDALANRVIPRTTVEWIGRRNVILDELARLARPHECLPFVYANRLWLHHPDWNRIRGWQLEDLS
jgi:hypothetical protein